MSFLDPLFLAGLGVAAAPIVIHLINRRKARPHRFAALEFVLRSQKRTARRWRIKQLLLLLVRTAAILAIPLALARPYLTLSGVSVTSAPGGGPASVVVVLDDSMSMGWRGDDGTLFEVAVAQARGVVDELGEEDNAAIIFGGAPARAASPDLTFDRAALREQLEGGVVGHRGADLNDALGLAWGLLEASALELKRVVLITDGQRAGFDPAKLPWPAGRGPHLRVLDVSEGAARPNRAVVDVTPSPAPEAGPGVWRFDVTVAASGGDAAVETPVALHVDGRLVAQGFVTPDPGGTVVKTFTAPVGAAGVRRGEVRLGGDALEADDVRSFSLRVRPSLQVLLVNGDPRTIPYNDEVFYLEKALLPGAGASSRLRPRVVQTSALATLDLSHVDVVILANVGEAPAGVAATLDAFVRRGGGLIVAAGDRMAGPRARWVDRLLPAPVRGVRKLGRDTGAPPVRLGPPPAGLPMFELFRGPAGEGLRAATFDRYLLVAPTREDDRTTLLSFGDGAPALLERRMGEGRVLLLTTTVDRDWSDLAVSTGFLPLMQEACHHVARSTARSNARSAMVGGAVTAPIPEGARSAEWRDPSGAVTPVPDEAFEGADRVSLSVAERPGVYSVIFRDRRSHQLRVEDVVVGSPPEESDLTPLSPELFAALSGPPSPEGGAEGAAPPPERRADLWPWSLLALMFLLLAETALVVRRRRAPPEVMGLG